MAYPTKYSRQYDFASYQVSNPTRPLPGDKVNVDLNAVVTSIGELVEFLKTSIRSDGQLANGSVGLAQLSESVNVGFEPPTVWEPGVAYTTDSTVFYGNVFYQCTAEHTSGVSFDESKWTEIVDFGAQATAAAASATAAAASETAAATSATASAASATSSADSATAASNSAAAASGSATTATTQATAASGSATAASTAETNAAASAAAAAASYDNFDDRYLGAKSSDPALDNDGNALLTGALYWNTVDPKLRVWTGAAWVDAVPLSGVTSIDSLSGAFTTDDSLSATSNVMRAQFKGHIYGLTLSNNSTDATNDIDIAAGEAADADGILLVLSSALTKRLDAAWAVGSGNGGLDTGSIANGTYHVFLIQRSDTGVVDALFSTSPSSPTMPTNYDRKRRIGAILRESAAIVAFRQYGDVFKRNTQVVVRNSTSVVTDTLLDMLVPTGVKVAPIFIADCQLTTAGQLIQLFSDGDLSAANESCNRVAGTEYSVNVITGNWITNTSGQLRFSLVNGSGTPSSARIQTQGWIDGRDQ